MTGITTAERQVCVRHGSPAGMDAKPHAVHVKIWRTGLDQPLDSMTRHATLQPLVHTGLARSHKLQTVSLYTSTNVTNLECVVWLAGNAMQ